MTQVLASPTTAEQIDAIEHVISAVASLINDGVLVPDAEWLAGFSDVFAAWMESRDSLADYPETVAEWASIASALYDDAIAMSTPVAAPSPAPVKPAPVPRLWLPRRITPRPKASPPTPPPATPPARSVTIGPTSGRRTGAVVLERPRRAPGTVTVPSWLSWVPRIR